jgi:hypothetical protein
VHISAPPAGTVCTGSWGGVDLCRYHFCLPEKSVLNSLADQPQNEMFVPGTNHYEEGSSLLLKRSPKRTRGHHGDGLPRPRETDDEKSINNREDDVLIWMSI